MAGFPEPYKDADGTDAAPDTPAAPALRFGAPQGRTVEHAAVAEARGGDTHEPAYDWGANSVLVGTDTEDEDTEDATFVQRLVQALTMGLYKPRKSAAELRRERLAAAAQLPMQGSYRIAVMNRKGGVAKTTTSVGSGSALGNIRGQGVLVLDCNPDAGTLEAKMTTKVRRNGRNIRQLVWHLTRNDGGVITPTELEDYLVRNSDGLAAIVSSSTDTRELTGSDYMVLAEALRHHYPFIITDTGTNIASDVNRAILNTTDVLVIPTTLAFDEYKATMETLGWLMKAGDRYAQLAQEAIIVITDKEVDEAKVNTEEARKQLKLRSSGTIIEVPWTQSIADGVPIDLATLRGTRKEPGPAESYEEVSLAILEALSAYDIEYADT